MIRKPDYSELPKDRQIVFLASGGRDSTALILEAFHLGIKGVMLHGDTGLECEKPLSTLRELCDYTGYECFHVRPEGNIAEILKESFYHIPDAIAFMQKTKIFRRNMFHCCGVLKHKPMNDMLLKRCKDTTLVSGLKGGDQAIHRLYRMRQLRERNTLLRLHFNGLLYYYPLRDLGNKDVDEVLKEHGFEDTEHSGCRICPIFCLFPNWVKRDAGTWLRSRNYARKLGISFPKCDQTMLTQFYCETTGQEEKDDDSL